MNNLDLAKSIVKSLGGKDNINKSFNCMTRMRSEIKDTSKVNEEELKNIDGVLGLVKEGNSYQVVLGPGKAKKVTDEAINYFGLSRDSKDTDWEENKKNIKAGQKNGAVKGTLKLIADIFIPMIPAIIAAGLFFGFASLTEQLVKQEVLANSQSVTTIILLLMLLS